MGTNNKHCGAITLTDVGHGGVKVMGITAQKKNIQNILKMWTGTSHDVIDFFNWHEL